MPEQFHLIITEHCTCAMDSRPSACRAPGTPFAWTALPLARSTPRRTAHCTSAWGTLPAPRASKRTTPQLQTTGLATHAITHATLTAAPGAMRSTAHLPVSSPTGGPTEGPSMRSNARHHARHHTRSNTARAAARNRLSTAAPADPARHLHSRCHRWLSVLTHRPRSACHRGRQEAPRPSAQSRPPQTRAAAERRSPP